MIQIKSNQVERIKKGALALGGVIPPLLFLLLGLKMSIIALFVFLVFVILFSLTEKGKKLIFEIYCSFLIRDELIKNGIYWNKKGEFADTPKVKVIKKKADFVEVVIENKSFYQLKLLEIDFSSTLKKFVWESSKLSSDSNFVIVKLIKEPEKRQYRLKSLEDLKKINSLFFLSIDKNVIEKKSQHILLSGRTGSGKTIALQYILLSYYFSGWSLKICDKKVSDTAFLAEKIADDYATETRDILDLLRRTKIEMNERKKELSKKRKLGKTAIDLGFQGVLIVVDEYLSLISSNIDKKIKEEILSIISEFLLEGRQLGFFVILTLQSAPSKDLPTVLKEQCSLKIVLGNSDEQTYNTSFFLNASKKISKKKLGIGGGWLVTDEQREPRIVYFPFLTDSFEKEVQEFIND